MSAHSAIPLRRFWAAGKWEERLDPLAGGQSSQTKPGSPLPQIQFELLEFTETIPSIHSCHSPISIKMSSLSRWSI